MIKKSSSRGYESEIILFEAAAREIQRLGAVPLPSAEWMQAEVEELTARSAALKAEQAKAQREARAYETMRRNVEEFLAPPKQEPQRKQSHELECPPAILPRLSFSSGLLPERQL